MRHVDDTQDEHESELMDVSPTIGQGGRRVWLYPKWMRGKKLTIRDLEHVSGGRAPAELKTKVSDGGWTSEGES